MSVRMSTTVATKAPISASVAVEVRRKLAGVTWVSQLPNRVVGGGYMLGGAAAVVAGLLVVVVRMGEDPRM